MRRSRFLATHLLRSPERPWGAYFLRAESFYNVATAAGGHQTMSLFMADRERLLARLLNE